MINQKILNYKGFKLSVFFDDSISLTIPECPIPSRTIVVYSCQKYWPSYRYGIPKKNSKIHEIILAFFGFEQTPPENENFRPRRFASLMAKALVKIVKPFPSNDQINVKVLCYAIQGYTSSLAYKIRGVQIPEIKGSFNFGVYF